MVSAFTPSKSLEQPAHNDYVDSWDIPVNADWGVIDVAFGGSSTVNLTGLSGSQALTLAQYRPLKIVLSGAPTAATNMVVPSGVGGQWVVRNNTTGGFAITIASAAGGALVAVPAGTQVNVTCDGTVTGMGYTSTVPAIAGGANTQVQFNSSGVLAGSANLTWNGTVLTTTGLTNTGNTLLGNAVADTTTVSGPMTVASKITSTLNGYGFPDGTTQTTAYQVTTQSVSGVTSINFPGIPATINNLEIRIDLKVSVDNTALCVQFYNAVGVVDQGPNYQTRVTGNFAVVLNAANYDNQAQMYLATNMSTVQSYSGTAFVNNIQSTTTPTQMTSQGIYVNFAVAGGPLGGIQTFCARSPVGRITGFRILPLIGTITGRVSLISSL